MTRTVQKGLLIFPILKDLNKADGILMKNEGIKDGFLQNGVSVESLEFTTKGIFNKEEQVYAFDPNRYKRICQYNISGWKKIEKYIRQKKYDFIWFRVPLITSPIANFIKSLKKNDPYCKIILEYGAYPYVNELTWFKKTIYNLNKRNEKITHRHADFVITYCGQKYVDNLMNIPINNGIDLSNIPVNDSCGDITKQVNFISVSSLKNWHAYERIITGLAAYSQQPNAVSVHFNIVGDGPEYEKLASLATQLDVKQCITFHKFKTGKELDTIYQNNHIAIGTLGFHRIGITNSSSLKNREYFARGLPVVLSTRDLDMPAHLPYVKYIPENEEPVNIAEVVSFAQKVYGISHLNRAIRTYAEEHVSWASKIKEVLAYLDGKQETSFIEERKTNKKENQL